MRGAMARAQGKSAMVTVTRLISDAFLSYAGLRLAYFIRFESGFIPAPKGVPPLSDYQSAFLLATLVYLLFLRWCRAYEAETTSSALEEFYTVILAVSGGSFLLLAGTFFYRGFSYSRLWAIIGWFTTVGLVSLGRAAINLALRALHSRGKLVLRVALIGEGLERLKEFIERRPDLGYRVTVHERDGGVGAVREVCERDMADVVLCSSRALKGEEVLEAAEVCEAHGKPLGVVAGPSELVLRRGLLRELGPEPVIFVRPTPLSGPMALVKRGIDIVVAGLLLVLLAPLMAVIALLVRLDSPGPVLFRQVRVGKDGRKFVMLKFRTMREGAEKETGPVWAVPNDPRCTRVGKWLRRLSLDELPQLWNVLKGEMSLVGPRPERPEFVEEFERRVPRYGRRHKVKSGMTGWAQVNGLRGNVPIEERTKYDLYYVENWSLLLDLKIMVRTAFEVLFHKGAY
ncbi:MAG TPA: sugar transferase [Armatimonadetes bacterium]|nr:sugar transferase [Armatimonadota bacterium]